MKDILEAKKAIEFPTKLGKEDTKRTETILENEKEKIWESFRNCFGNLKEP